MGPKRNPLRGTSSKKASSSRTQPPPTPPAPAEYDTNLFVNNDAAELFKKIYKRSVVRERGFDFDEAPAVQHPGYELIKAEIVRRRWNLFCDSNHVDSANCSIIYEFFANFSYQDAEQNNFVRGKLVPTSAYAFNQLLGLPSFSAQEDEYWQLAHFEEPDYDAVAEVLSMEGAHFSYHNGRPKELFRWQLNPLRRRGFILKVHVYCRRLICLLLIESVVC